MGIGQISFSASNVQYGLEADLPSPVKGTMYRATDKGILYVSDDGEVWSDAVGTDEIVTEMIKDAAVTQDKVDSSMKKGVANGIAELNSAGYLMCPSDYIRMVRNPTADSMKIDDLTSGEIAFYMKRTATNTFIQRTQKGGVYFQLPSMGDIVLSASEYGVSMAQSLDERHKTFTSGNETGFKRLTIGNTDATLDAASIQGCCVDVETKSSGSAYDIRIYVNSTLVATKTISSGMTSYQRSRILFNNPLVDGDTVDVRMYTTGTGDCYARNCYFRFCAAMGFSVGTAVTT